MPTWIRRLRHQRDDEDARPVTEGQRAANAALDMAEAARARVRAQACEVRAEADTWRGRRQRNHFGQLVRDIVLGGDGR